MFEHMSMSFLSIMYVCCVPIPIGSPSGVYHVCMVSLFPLVHHREFSGRPLGNDVERRIVEMMWNEELCKGRIAAHTFGA